MYNQEIHSWGDHTLTADIKDKRSLTKSPEPLIIDSTYSASTHRLRNIDHKRRFITVKPENK